MKSDWYIPAVFIVVLMAWLFFLIWFFAGAARADDEDLFGENNAQYGRFDKYNPALLEMRRTGVSCWEYVQEPSGANIRDAIIETKAEAAAEFGFRVEERAGCWRHVASGGMAFVYGNSLHGPGGTGAIGIVDKYLTSGQQIVYDSAAMVMWPRSSQKEVVHHEDTGHVLGNFAEGYIHQGGQIRCAPLDTPQRRSFMNCGLLNNQFIDDYIRATWKKSHGNAPLTVFGTGMNAAGMYVYACNFESTATRLSVIYEDYGPRYWSGIIKEIKPDANGCMGIGEFEGMYVSPGRCYWLKQENAAGWKVSRNEVKVMCA